MFPILEGEFEVKVKVKGQQKKITKITSYNLNNEIEDYLGFSAFATAVWCLNKPINLHSPKSVERRHPNAIKLPESNTALVHFGRFLTHNIGATIKGDTILGEPLKNGERSRPLLHGSKYAEAAINATCMACDRKCSSAGRTGKMKDARLSVLQGVPWCTSCARKHEARTTDYGIDVDVVPFLDGLLCRAKYPGRVKDEGAGKDQGRRKGGGKYKGGGTDKGEDKGEDKGGGEGKGKGGRKEKGKGGDEGKGEGQHSFYSIGKGIPGLFPEELSLRYFAANNKDAIEAATVIAREAARTPEQDEKSLAEALRVQHKIKLKKEIVHESGKDFAQFVRDAGWFGPCCLKFREGKDCVGALDFIHKHPSVDFKTIVNAQLGETIDMGTLLQEIASLDPGANNRDAIEAARNHARAILKGRGEKEEHQRNIEAVIPTRFLKVFRSIPSRDDRCRLFDAITKYPRTAPFFADAVSAESAKRGANGDVKTICFHSVLVRVGRVPKPESKDLMDFLAADVALGIRLERIVSGVEVSTKKKFKDFVQQEEVPKSLNERARSFKTAEDFLEALRVIKKHAPSLGEHTLQAAYQAKDDTSIDIGAARSKLNIHIKSKRKKKRRLDDV